MVSTESRILHATEPIRQNLAQRVTLDDGADQHALRVGTPTVPAHSFESWRFCFQRPSHPAVIWATPAKYRAGPRYGPAFLELDCDLARAPDPCDIVRSGSYGKWG